MKRSFIGVQRYIAFRSPSAEGGHALYAEAKARVNPGEGFRESAMEDVSSFGREMIFHHRTGPFRRSAEGRLYEVSLREDENGYLLFRIFKGDIKKVILRDAPGSRDGDGPSLLTRTLVDLAQRGESLSLDHEFLAEKFVAKLNPAVQAAGGVFNLGELIQFEVRLQLTSRLLGATSRSIDETSDNAFSSTIV
jgi:hypothetical protein